LLHLNVILVIASAALHAAWYAILKGEADKERAVTKIIGIAALVSAAFTLVAPFKGLTLAFVTYSISAGLFQAAYSFALARALGQAGLGPVYTLARGTGLVLVWLVSIVLFQERPGVAALIGAMLILGGLGVSSGGLRVFTDRAGLLTAALAGVGAAGLQLCHKAALMQVGSAALSSTIGLAVAFAVLSLFSAPRVSLAPEAMLVIGLNDPKIRRPAYLSRAIVIAGFLAGVSFVMFLIALSDGEATKLSTLRNVSVMFTQVFAVFLRERVRWSGVAAAVMVVTGAFLIA
jgi:drug/metabolite transporter (DMT)-like permease